MHGKSSRTRCSIVYMLDFLCVPVFWPTFLFLSCYFYCNLFADIIRHNSWNHYIALVVTTTTTSFLHSRIMQPFASANIIAASQTWNGCCGNASRCVIDCQHVARGCQLLCLLEVSRRSACLKGRLRLLSQKIFVLIMRWSVLLFLIR